VQQSKSTKQKVDDDLYEMSKPLARYKNDEDLDKMLRDRERAEDPMLAFMQKQKAKQDVIAGKKGNVKIVLIELIELFSISKVLVWFSFPSVVLMGRYSLICKEGCRFSMGWCMREPYFPLLSAVCNATISSSANRYSKSRKCMVKQIF
jgi:hypothetical protein